ncbi:MAG: LysM peptidoglycan-binding domain-containing protein, partial [Chloroflexi bacterium]|nr:LysM peptidoglycan-binding domain-containing protein [Chloroflexota bacterium]
MRIRRVVILSAVLLVALFIAAISTAQAQQRIHIVQPGETLSGIALRYGVTVQQIAAVNNIVNPSLIFVGQRLIIPGPEPPPPGDTTTYTVQRGDNLTIIARRFNTTVATLVQLNGLTNPSLIFLGQVLVVPAPAQQTPQPQPTATSPHQPQPTATSAQPTPVPERVTYTVQRGDTLSRIALRYGVTVQELVMLNNIANPN